MLMHTPADPIGLAIARGWLNNLQIKLTVCMLYFVVHRQVFLSPIM